MKKLLKKILAETLKCKKTRQKNSKPGEKKI